jgi:hypothetical protein
VYVSDVPDDSWSTGVDSQGRSARRRAEAEGGAERFGDSDDDEESPERLAARSSSKAAGKRPLDEGASQREGQGSRLRTGGALNIGAEETTRKRQRAILDSDEEDQVPISRVFWVRRSSPEQAPPCRATPPQTSAPETTRAASDTARTGRPASPRGPPPGAPTPPRETSPSRTTALETTRAGRRASPQGPLPRSPTSPRAWVDVAPSRTGEANSGVPERRQTSAEGRTQDGSGSAEGRGGAGRRFRSSFRWSDM